MFNLDRPVAHAVPLCMSVHSVSVHKTLLANARQAVTLLPIDPRFKERNDGRPNHDGRHSYSDAARLAHGRTPHLARCTAGRGLPRLADPPCLQRLRARTPTALDGRQGSAGFNTAVLDLHRFLPLLFVIVGRDYGPEEVAKCLPLFTLAMQGIRPAQQDIMRTLVKAGVFPAASGEASG